MGRALGAPDEAAPVHDPGATPGPGESPGVETGGVPGVAAEGAGAAASSGVGADAAGGGDGALPRSGRAPGGVLAGRQDGDDEEEAPDFGDGLGQDGTQEGEGAMNTLGCGVEAGEESGDGGRSAAASQGGQRRDGGDVVANWGAEERRLLEALGFIAGGGGVALGQGGESWGAGVVAGRAALGRVSGVWSGDLPHALVASVRSFVGEVLALRAGGRAMERYTWSRVVCPVI